MKQTTNKTAKQLIIPPFLLWSYNKKKIDPEKMYKTIIEQVIDRGSIKDIANVIMYYGINKVQEVTLQMPVLNPKRVNLMALLWDIPIEQFKAWNTRDWEKVYGGFFEKRNSI